MSVEVFMPRLGLTMQEGTIVAWLKQEGDLITKGEAVAEMTTEKITNVIESQASGILEKVLYKEGDTVPSGTVIAYIAEATAEKKELDHVPSTGKQNSEIIDRDRRIKQVIPLVGIRKVIAERMQESMRRSPQATATTRADVTALSAFRASLAQKGIKYTVTDLFVKIIALALEQNPILNASLQEGKLIMYESVNVGVAVAVENALLVPVIKNVQEKSLPEISAEVSELVRKARGGALLPEDMSGGTFTLSNLGMFNVDAMTPILNPPEAGIMAIGPFHKEAKFGDDDSLQVRQVATLSLTFDHSVTDGVPASRFLESINKILLNPTEYLQ